MRAVGILIVLAACGSPPPPASPAPPASPPAQASPPPTSPPPPAAAAQPTPDRAAEAGSFTVSGVIARMGAFRDDMCTCKYKPCAERVTNALTRWGQDLAAHPSPDTQRKISEEETQQMAEITESMTKCMTDAMLAGQPGASPPPANP